MTSLFVMLTYGDVGGIFVSLMVIGGSIGRMWGEMLHDKYGKSFPTHQGVLVPASKPTMTSSFVTVTSSNTSRLFASSFPILLYSLFSVLCSLFSLSSSNR